MKGKSEELPKVNYLWVGPPKIDLSEKNKLGSDVVDVIDMSRKATNTICFYCLDEHTEYYNDLFKKNNAKVEVKSIDKYISDMQKHADNYISENANKMAEVRKELLTEPRNRIVDKVTFKDAFALFLLACEGGYTLDAGIKLANNVNNFTFPAEDNFKVPVGREYECWLMYAAPNKLDQSRTVFDNYISRWDATQKIIRGNVSDIHKISKFHHAITFLMIDSISKGLKTIKNNDLQKWRFNFDTDDTSLAKVTGYPIIKIYRGSHKPYVEIKEILMKKIGEYIKQSHDIKSKDRKELVSNIKNALKILKKTTVDDYKKLIELNDKLHQVFTAIEEIDTCYQNLRHTKDVNLHARNAYLQLNNFLQGTSKDKPEIIVENFRKNISALSPKREAELNNALLAKARNDLASISDEALNYTDEEGASLMHSAVQSGKPERVKALLERGANPNIQDNEEKTALHYAVKLGRQDLVIALLPSSAPNIADKMGMTPLHDAVKLNQTEIVISLLKQDATAPNAQDKQGLTPLHHAINAGNIELISIIVDELVKRNISLDIANPNGISPLLSAVQKGSPEIVAILLKNGANVNCEDKSGMTVFHYAVLSKKVELIAPLVALGANPNRPLDKALPPLCHAVFFSNLEYVNALLEAGTDPNMPNKDNKTPLHIAAMQGKKEIVDLLLSKGANPNILDNNKKTPLDYANERKHSAIAEELKIITAKPEEIQKITTEFKERIQSIKEGEVQNTEVINIQI